MSIGDQAFEIWRQADDVLAMYERGSDVPTAAEWARHRETMREYLDDWQKRLADLARQSDDVSPTIRRDWHFPD